MKLSLVVSAALVALAFPMSGAHAVDLHAYVGAGLRGPVQELITSFTAETGLKVDPEYGGSGQLNTRIEETGKGEVVVAGSSVYTDQLAAKGLLAGETRILVLHGPVIAVASAKAGEIKSLADLAKPGVSVGLGDAKAMALGRTAEEILKKVPEGEAIFANVKVRAATVEQLATYVLEGNVDAAIVGAADAAKNPGKYAVVQIPTNLYTPDKVSAAALKSSADPEASKKFVDYLASPKGIAVFVRFGFPPAP